MKIETKYNVDDEVWILYEYRPYKTTIQSIVVSKFVAAATEVHLKIENNNLPLLSYILYNTPRGIPYSYPKQYLEKELYPTEEDLIEDLKKS